MDPCNNPCPVPFPCCPCLSLCPDEDRGVVYHSQGSYTSWHLQAFQHPALNAAQLSALPQTDQSSCSSQCGSDHWKSFCQHLYIAFQVLSCVLCLLFRFSGPFINNKSSLCFRCIQIPGNTAHCSSDVLVLFIFKTLHIYSTMTIHQVVNYLFHQNSEKKT